MISIQHLKKAYPNVTPFFDVNVEIEKGEVISIIGPSGTGKSTLLRCLNLLEMPTAGEIIVDGEVITAKGADITAVRRKMGMVFQSFNLFSHLTVIENIMLGPVDLLKLSRQEAYDEGLRLLATVGLAEKALNYPDELSGGQKQRVAIARALAMKPQIILFDEPTSALDPTMVGEVLAVIRSLAREGLTMMIVTHEMKFARDVSTRILYMDEGGIYEDGSPEQIFDAPRRERTRIFVKRLKTFERDIESLAFDFIEVSVGIEEFGRRQLLSQRQVNNLQLVFEELCVQTLLKRGSEVLPLRFSASVSELDGSCEAAVFYSGPAFDPFTDQADELSIRLVLGLTKEHEWSGDSGNHITLIL
ncbi:MAG: amino acid ABC transporter ATP-binding protein [Candidatus Metalachnospira sp.]|nr:amino acid ABC transporter ATP-binding protein [Candidatus Metalachnospira sp.]